MKSEHFLKEGFVEDASDVHADHEVQMARSDLFHAAEDALVLHKLLRNVSEQQGLEGWVAAKITLASDYLKTVREYIEYELMTAASEQPMLPIAEGSGSKEKQKTPYRDINSPEHRAAADKQKQRMAKDAAAEPGKKLADKIAKKGVAEGDNSDVSDISDSDYMRIKGIVDKKYPGYKLSSLGMDNDGNINVEIYNYETNDVKHLKTQSTSEKQQGVAEGYYDLPNQGNIPGMEPIDFSSKPSFKDLITRYTQLVYQGHAGEMSPEEDQEYDDIENYVAQRFGEKGSAHLQKAGQVSYWGRDDKPYGRDSRSSNLGRPNQPSGDFRTTKAGKMHGQDAKTMKSKVTDRLGRHPAPNLPEQSVAEGSDEKQSFKVSYHNPKTRQDKVVTIKALNKDEVLDYCANKGYKNVHVEQGVSEDDSAVQSFLSKGGKIQQLPYKKPRKADKTDYGSKHIGGSGDKMKASRTGTAAKTQGNKVAGMSEGSTCNHTMEGKSCPMHGLKECPGYKSSIEETTAGSVAGVVNPTPKNKAKVGTLFGGTYKQKKTK